MKLLFYFVFVNFKCNRLLIAALKTRNSQFYKKLKKCILSIDLFISYLWISSFNKKIPHAFVTSINK